MVRFPKLSARPRDRVFLIDYPTGYDHQRLFKIVNNCCGRFYVFGATRDTPTFEGAYRLIVESDDKQRIRSITKLGCELCVTEPWDHSITILTNRWEVAVAVTCNVQQSVSSAEEWANLFCWLPVESMREQQRRAKHFDGREFDRLGVMKLDAFDPELFRQEWR